MFGDFCPEVYVQRGTEIANFIFHLAGALVLLLNWNLWQFLTRNIRSKCSSALQHPQTSCFPPLGLWQQFCLWGYVNLLSKRGVDKVWEWRRGDEGLGFGARCYRLEPLLHWTKEIFPDLLWRRILWSTAEMPRWSLLGAKAGLTALQSKFQVWVSIWVTPVMLKNRSLTNPSIFNSSKFRIVTLIT